MFFKVNKPKSSPIICRIFGGLGNQLFAYSAARRLALFNKVELALDHVSGFCYDSEYQRHFQLDHFEIPCRKASAEERLEPFSRIRRNLIRRLNDIRPFEKRCYIQQQGSAFEARLLGLRPSGKLHLEGYWQSEKYFKDVENQIREDLIIIPPKDAANRQTAEKIKNEIAVAVHVRFFDDPVLITEKPSISNNASRNYYLRAIAEMEQRVPGAHYFIFSDRPEIARARISVTDDRITLVHHNHGDTMAYADLWLMTQCKHFIIANSTFSWWGAWLAYNSNKIIIAPRLDKKFSVSWSDPKLLPSHWIQV